jgi:pilus assembly protein CpaB
MMRRPGNILLLAIVIGALGAAMVYRYLRQQQEALEQARRTTGGPTVDVIVANDTIPIGSRIQPNQIRAIRWPADAVPEGAIQKPADAVDAFARMTLEKNEPLLQPELVREASGLLPMLITEGMRGMSVKVDNVTGVSGFITPESRVDVLVAGNTDTGGGSGGSKQRSKVILQNIKVLATGQTIEQRDNKPVAVPTVTLLISPDDAEKLALATRQEPVRLVLRNYLDNGIVETPGATLVKLFGEDYKPPVPVTAAAPVVKKVEKKAAPRYSVEIMLGEKVQHQDFF